MAIAYTNSINVYPMAMQAVRRGQAPVNGLAGLGAVTIRPDPDFFTSLVENGLKIFDTFTGARYARESQAAQAELARQEFARASLEAGQQTRTFMIVGGVLVAAMATAVILKKAK